MTGIPETEYLDHAPENLSLLKKIVLNLLRMDTTDTVFSLRLRRK